MPRDFAKRATSTRGSKRKPAKKRKPVSPAPRTLFHGPSFAFGALLGAAIVITASYAPEMLRSDTTPGTAHTTGANQEPAVQFEFPDLLRDEEVQPDPDAYVIPKPDPATEPATYTIQAASFRNESDAEQLRAQLLLQNLPARTDSSSVNGETWYRVSVGPFERRVEADRALTRLREQQLSAILVR